MNLNQLKTLENDEKIVIGFGFVILGFTVFALSEWFL